MNIFDNLSVKSGLASSSGSPAQSTSGKEGSGSHHDNDSDAESDVEQSYHPALGLESFFDASDLEALDFDGFEQLLENVEPDDQPNADNVEDLLAPFAMLDELASEYIQDEVKPMCTRKVYTGTYCKVTLSERREPQFTEYPQVEDAKLIEEGDVVYLVFGERKERVGVGSMKSEVFNITFSNAFDRAQRLGEESEAKGTCLGYSSLVHCAAVITLLNSRSIYEPCEGHDASRQGLMIEVTGMNYDKRKTNADIIINKYLILQFLGYYSGENKTYFSLSIKEDLCITDGFKGSSLDQGAGPYTPSCDVMHEYVARMPARGFELLGEQYRSYLSRQDCITDREISTTPNSIMLRKALLSGSLDKDGNQLLLPSVFRILPGNYIDRALGEAMKISPRTDGKGASTTFRNRKHDDDPLATILNSKDYGILVPNKSFTKPMELIFRLLLGYDIFTSIYVESELMSKIVGKSGCFYSTHTRCGISWKAIRSNSLTYYLCYYRVGKPPPSCGVWELINTEHDVYRSPTFKSSIQDFEFAKILPYRIYTMVSSTLGYTNHRERAFMTQKILQLASIMRGSSWQTSLLTKNFRFLTLCSLSNSGDVESMINDVAKDCTDRMPFCDSYIVQLLISFADNYTTRKTNVTPILGMPIRFIGIEKDISLCFQWHMRKGDQDTKCFQKLIKGVVTELDTRAERLEAYQVQVDYLHKISGDGASQSDFDEMMSKMPKFPYFNVLIFMGLAYFSTENLQAGYRQSPTQFSLKNLLSDKHCYRLSPSKFSTNAVASDARVADELCRILDEYEQPKSALSLLVRISKGPQVSYVFTIHSKDSKSSYREIPQMNIYMRVPQMCSESFVSIYTEAEEADMMTNKQKFSDFAVNFSDLIRDRGMTRSEDKSFFCGNMHPEYMSVCVAIAAKLTGTTSLVTAAALIRTDSSRYTIIPNDYDRKTMPTGIEAYSVNRKVANKVFVTLALKNQMHFQQGTRGQTGALVNTIFSTGMECIQRDVLVDLDKPLVYTTSDDSVRGATTKKDGIYDHNSTLDDFMGLPPSQVHHAMMKDSAQKPIRSSKLAEFNNTVVGPKGLMPGSFIHSNLVIQPLGGLSVIDDLYSCVAMARSSITWGDSIDVARAAYHSNVVLAQQKWLLTEDDIHKLYDIGILPRTDEELLAGGKNLSNEVLSKLASLMSDESAELARQGKIKLHDGLRKHTLKPKERKSKTRLVKYNGTLEVLKYTVDMINSSRRMGGNLSTKYIRASHFNTRRKISESFMKTLRDPTPELSEVKKLLVSEFPKIYEVSIHPTTVRVSDFQPIQQGQSATITDKVNLNSVIAKRTCGVTVTNHLTDRENELVEMNETEFKVAWYLEKTRQSNVGFSFKSPTGRPMMRIHNNDFFTKPMGFAYSMNLPDPVDREATYTFNGIKVENFHPCWYGGRMLNHASRSQTRLAYGYSVAGDRIKVYYKNPMGRPTAYEVAYCELNFITVKTRNFQILCPLKKDNTPIVQGSFGMKAQINIIGHIVGDGTACLNYGNFLNTSASSACSTMQQVFRRFDSDLPNFLYKHKPEYPNFRENCTEIPMGRVTELSGNKRICDLKLTFHKKPTDRVKVDLNGAYPVQVALKEGDDQDGDWY